MLSSGQYLVFCVIDPLTVILAYKCVLGGSLWRNIAAFSVPMLIGTFALGVPHRTVGEHVFILVAMEVLFVVFAYIGYRVERYAHSKYS